MKCKHVQNLPARIVGPLISPKLNLGISPNVKECMGEKNSAGTSIGLISIQNSFVNTSYLLPKQLYYPFGGNLVQSNWWQKKCNNSLFSKFGLQFGKNLLQIYQHLVFFNWPIFWFFRAFYGSYCDTFRIKIRLKKQLPFKFI